MILTDSERKVLSRYMNQRSIRTIETSMTFYMIPEVCRDELSVNGLTYSVSGNSSVFANSMSKNQLAFYVLDSSIITFQGAHILFRLEQVHPVNALIMCLVDIDSILDIKARVNSGGCLINNMTPTEMAEHSAWKQKSYKKIRYWFSPESVV